MMITFLCSSRALHIFCEIDWWWGNYWSLLSSVPALHCWHNQMQVHSLPPSLWHLDPLFLSFLEERFSKQDICSPSAKPTEAILGAGKEGGKIIGLDALFPGMSIWDHSDSDVISDKWWLVITIIIAFSTIVLRCSNFYLPKTITNCSI